MRLLLGNTLHALACRHTPLQVDQFGYGLSVTGRSKGPGQPAAGLLKTDGVPNGGDGVDQAIANSGNYPVFVSIVTG